MRGPHLCLSATASRARLTFLVALLDAQRFAKEKIALAPNNPSAWNYLRGALEHTNTLFASVASFVEPYTTAQPPRRGTDEDVVDLDNPLPSEGAELPCVAALEFMADIYEKQGADAIGKAVEVRVCSGRSKQKTGYTSVPRSGNRWRMRRIPFGRSTSVRLRISV